MLKSVLLFAVFLSLSKQAPLQEKMELNMSCEAFYTTAKKSGNKIESCQENNGVPIVKYVKTQVKQFATGSSLSGCDYVRSKYNNLGQKIGDCKTAANGNTFYRVDDKTLNWNAARLFCQMLGYGGDLASIRNFEEFEAFATLIQWTTLKHVYLGATNNGGWKWADRNDAVDGYARWLHGYPYGGKCMLGCFWTNNGWTRVQVGWYDDQPCSNPYSFMCKLTSAV